MDWGNLAGTLIGAGAPILGRLIGGTLLPIGGGEIGAAIGSKLAAAFGVESTPEAVNKALATEDPSVTIEKLKGIEAEAAARWPALAQMAVAQQEAETAQFQAQLADTQDARHRDVEVRQLNAGVNTRANILIVLAFAMLMAIVVFIFMKITDLSQPGTIAVLTFLTTIAGNITQWIGNVFNFEFGSSRGSTEKSNQIADMSNTAAVLAKTAASTAAGQIAVQTRNASIAPGKK